MKQIYLFIFLMATAIGLSAQDYKLGTTSALWRTPLATDFEQAKQSGIEYLEVAFNQCYRGVAPDEVKPRLQKMKARIDSAGIQVWSVHLPFSRTLDISVADAKLREENVRFMAEAIRLSGMFHPSCLVLHPSSEPIADVDREERIINTIQSIAYLKQYADEIGAELCIENLPRTCLGNTPEELLRIVDAVPGVKVCFDTNHYFRGTIAHFMHVIGHKVGTIHASDFDFVHELHWLPTQGKIDWGELVHMLKGIGYQGVFMYEATKDHEHQDLRPGPERVAETFQQVNVNYNIYIKE